MVHSERSPNFRDNAEAGSSIDTMCRHRMAKGLLARKPPIKLQSLVLERFKFIVRELTSPSLLPQSKRCSPHQQHNPNPHEFLSHASNPPSPAPSLHQLL